MKNTIYVLYHSYDKTSDSLVVSFASNETESQNPADYNPVVIQPLLQFPNVTSREELENRIFEMGIDITRRQKILEDCSKGKIDSTFCESLVEKKTSRCEIDN